MLRPYQKDCIETTLSELKNNTKQIVSLPVGSGKTVIMANLIPLIPNPTPKATKVLLLAHRTELLEQAHKQITMYNPNLIVEIEQGNRKVNIDGSDVVIASVATLGRENSSRIEKFDPDLFKSILVDEAHHAVAETYMRIFKYFGILNKNNKKLLWGCTATVDRHDGKSLKPVFDSITFQVGFLKMIENGYLSQMRVTTVHTQIDLDHVSHTKADFNQKQLAVAINTKARNEVIVSSWFKYAHAQGRKSTLVFACDIEHTMELCDEFVKKGIQAKFITSKSNEIDRKNILQDFRAQKFPVLVNCAILTEGTDIPCIDCILLARPTRSATLFQQMFGRGLRLFPGKKNCLVIDLVDNFKRTGVHGLITVPTLLGLDPTEMVEDKDLLELEKESKEEELEMKVKKEPVEYNPDQIKINVVEYDTLHELIIDLSTTDEIKSASIYNWVAVGPEKCVLHVINQGNLILEANKGVWTGAFGYENTKTGLYAKPFSLPMKALDLHSAIRAADTWVKKQFQKNSSALWNMTRQAPFRKDVISEAQKTALQRYKIKVPNNLNKGQAMDLLIKLKFGQLNIWKSSVKKMIKEAKQKAKKQSQGAILKR